MPGSLIEMALIDNMISIEKMEVQKSRNPVEICRNLLEAQLFSSIDSLKKKQNYRREPDFVATMIPYDS